MNVRIVFARRTEIFIKQIRLCFIIYITFLKGKDMEDFLTGKKHIHFIGIGGSGMYPLAQILHSKGFYLTGSDNNETETLDLDRKSVV